MRYGIPVRIFVYAAAFLPMPRGLGLFNPPLGGQLCLGAVEPVVLCCVLLPGLYSLFYTSGQPLDISKKLRDVKPQVNCSILGSLRGVCRHLCCEFSPSRVHVSFLPTHRFRTGIYQLVRY